MRTFRISGAAMSCIEGSELYQRPERYDQGQGSLDASAALRAATPNRRGRGYSYEVTVSEAGADVLRDYCQTVGETFAAAGPFEDETRREGRALLKVAQSIEAAPVERERAPNECSCGAPGTGTGDYADVCDRWPLCHRGV